MDTFKKIPVYIISGFLGSGKTTILLKLLEELKMRGLVPGIILNELGELNVESHLFSEENIVELLNGCICCSIQKDLKSTLDYFINQSVEQVDMLLIEGTGVANPLEIQLALNERGYSEHFSLHSIIGVIDASNYLDYQSIFTSSSEIRSLLKQQITCSSIVILNKIDLIAPNKIQKIEDKIARTLKNDIPIYKTQFCELPIEILLDNKSIPPSNSIELTEIHNQHHAHHEQIQSMSIKNVHKVTRIIFEDWLKGLSGNILRGKGIVQLENDGFFYNFQYSSNQLLMKKIEQDKNTKTSIILIGYELDQEQIKNSFDSLHMIDIKNNDGTIILSR